METPQENNQQTKKKSRADKKSPKKKTSHRIIFLLLGLAAVGFMIYKTGVENIFQQILKTGWWFIPIIFVWAVVYLLNTFSWRNIIYDNHKRACPVPFHALYKITVSGFAINYITPMVSLGGEPYRILELKNYIGLQKATSSVILYSMTHFTSHFLLWLTTSIFVLFYYDLNLGFIIGLSIVILICAGLITLFFTGYRKGLLVKTFRILSKIPLIKGWAKRFSQTRKGNIAKIDSQIAELYTRKKDFYGSLLLEYSARIVGCLEVYFISLALSAGLNFLDSVVVIAATSLFSNILFFSPLQLGTREGGFLLVFEALKSSSAFGMAMSLITRIRETIWIIIGLILMNGKAKDTIKKTEEDPIL